MDIDTRDKIGNFRENKAFFSKDPFIKFWSTKRGHINQEVDKKCQEMFGCKTVRSIPFEISSISRIKKAFPQLDFIDQYYVKVNNKKYRIDTYNEKCKIAIEIDEYQHTQQVTEDQIRQENIECKLDCTFIRINNNTDFTDVVASINKIIHKKQKEEIKKINKELDNNDDLIEIFSEEIKKLRSEVSILKHKV